MHSRGRRDSKKPLLPAGVFGAGGSMLCEFYSIRNVSRAIRAKEELFMIAKLFEVKETEGKGKGLFAKELIPKGTIVWFECGNPDNARVLTAEEIGYDKMSENEKLKLFDYAYRMEDGMFIAFSDDTRYLNHSCNANILGTDLGFDIAVKDIKKGEEATYDYRDFCDEVEMPCLCGEENCCKVLKFIHPVPEELKSLWKERVDSALRLVNNVEQPLREELKQISVFLPLELP